MTRLQRLAKGTPAVRSRLAFYLFLNIFDLTPYSQSDSDAASDAIIACLLSEIIASPVCDASTLPGDGVATEETEILNASERHLLEDGLRLGKSSVDDVDWMKQVRAEMEMDRLLKLIPDAHEGPNCDVDMDFSNMVAWDGVAVS